MWALGVLLFELLTLQRPFNGTNIAVLALNITQGTYDEEKLEHSPYPQWVRRLASKEGLLHPDPLKRLPLPQLLAAVDGSEAGPTASPGSLARAPPPVLINGVQLINGLLSSPIKEVPETEESTSASTTAAGADDLNALDTLERFDPTGSV